MKTPWFIRPAPRVKPKLRLICFPYAGGNAATYHHWHKFLPVEVELVLVQLPGRATRIMEPPLDDMQQVIDALLGFAAELTEVPYILFGHSLGSRIAFELANQLQQQDFTAAQHLILSGSRAAHLHREQKQTYLLPNDEFIRELTQLNGTPQVVLKNQELLDLLLPLLRADFRIAECYQAQQAQLDSPFTVLYGTQDLAVSYEDVLAWQQLSSKGAEFLAVEGDHFFIDNQPQEVQAKVSQVVESELEKLGVVAAKEDVCI